MNKIYLSALVFLPALFTLFTACNMTDPEPIGSSEKATVRVSIDDGTKARTVKPSLQQADAWEVWGAVQGESETLLAEFSSTGGVMFSLDTGVWNFTLKGYKEEVLILIGSIAEKTINQGANTLAFTVELAASAEGEGTIALTVQLPVGSGITEARVFKDGELDTSLEPIENRIVFEEAIHSGSYYFSIRLYKDETLYGVVSEIVLVGANLRSEKTYTLANTDLNLTYTITYHFGDGETEIDYYQYTDANKTLPTPSTSYPDRVFMGWYESADLSGNAVAVIPSGSTTGDKDFYAWWAELVDTPFDLSLAESLAWISANAEEGGVYSITLKADEALVPTELSYGIGNVGIVIDGGTVERVISLDSTGSLFSVGDRVTLTMGNNVTLQGRSDNTDSLVRVNEGGTLVMDAGSKVSGNTASSGSYAYGGGVYVDGGTFTMSGGEVSGNSAIGKYYAYGGGVYVNGGTFTISDGEISDNTVSISDYTGSSANGGGGVYVNGGTFTMSGGSISGNTATSNYSTYGGGVYNSGTFTMYAGSISGNTASTTSSATDRSAYGGGVYSSGTFTMYAGEISGNTGSGVSNGGTFTMSGGEISGNTGSGVSNGGTFTMNAGKISGNTGSGVGNIGTFTMNNGSISGNTGSGVSNGWTFTMNAGEISGNTASYGGGVYVYQNGTFEMSGGSISGNTASSGYSASGGGVYVSNGGTFTMNDGKISDNSVSVSASSVSASAYGGGVYVSNSGTFEMNDGEISGNSAYSNSSGSSVYSASAYAYGGGVSGSLTMSGGSISGNTASASGSASASASTYGGGVSGSLTMSGGSISGNTASASSVSASYSSAYAYGGGVSGSLTMSGGSISGNTASASHPSYAASNGGGVYVGSGTFEMSGGEISGNSANYGGGVYNSGTFTMNAGEISGNTASSQGGGVYVNSGTFTKQADGTIYGLNAPVSLRNTASSGDNYGHAVYVYSSNIRNTTAGVGVTLNSNVSGADGGWETTWSWGSVQITLPVADDPQLSNVSLLANDSVIFNTETNYTSWTWYWNDEVISNATSSTYTLTADKSKTPGIYELSVVVVNNAGESLSARCRVTVKAY